MGDQLIAEIEELPVEEATTPSFPCHHTAIPVPPHRHSRATTPPSPCHHTVIPEWGYRESILTLTCRSLKPQPNMDSR